jgi:hypothetical protein
MTAGMRRALLGVVAGGALLVVALTAGRDQAPASGSPERSARQQESAGTGDQTPVVDLRLELLEGRHGELAEPERDPFRFRPRAAPPAPRPAPRPQSGPAPIVSTVPTGPPAPPPIQLRFIGLVDAPTQAGRVAIVSDGRGNVFYGKEGDTIEGRYKVLRVSPDVIELAYLDGRGRQTIRLTGQ